jgi:hypothetical protein
VEKEPMKEPEEEWDGPRSPRKTQKPEGQSNKCYRKEKKKRPVIINVFTNTFI